MTEAAPKLCAIVPAFDAVETLPVVLEGVERWGMPIIVVDDGSRDGTREWLERWSGATTVTERNARAGGTAGSVGVGDDVAHNEPVDASSRRIVVTRSENGGKAAALRDGFARAIELGFDAAVTIDADGQHDPADAPRLIEKYIERLRTHGVPAIVCGERSAATPGYPLRNLAGRRLNDLAIRAQTGVRVSDCPCGLRVYPLDAVRRVRCMSGRFAWEEEFLTRAIWAGFGYERVPIRCIYGVDAARQLATARGARGREAVDESPVAGTVAPGPTTRSTAGGEGHRHRSHYRFRRDWPEGIAINLWLVMLALLPPAPTPQSLTRFLRQLRGALSPSRAIEHVVGDSPARLHGAASMAIGAIGLRFPSALSGASTDLLTRFDSSTWRHGLLSAVAAWIVVRLHGSLLLALGGGAVSWSATRATAVMIATDHDMLTGAPGGLAAVAAGAMPFLAALLLLLVPSVIALRRRAP